MLVRLVIGPKIGPVHHLERVELEAMDAGGESLVERPTLGAI